MERDEDLYKCYIMAYVLYQKGAPHEMQTADLNDRQLAAVAIGFHEAATGEVPDTPNDWERTNPIDEMDEFYDNDDISNPGTYSY